jgi:hypothetical protein
MTGTSQETGHTKEVPMRVVIRFAVLLAVAAGTLVAGQTGALAATAIEYGLIAAL